MTLPVGSTVRIGHPATVTRAGQQETKTRRRWGGPVRRRPWDDIVFCGKRYRLDEEPTIARTVIDLDEKIVAEVMEIFGTTVKAQAVRAALEDVVKRRRRQVGIDMLKSGELVIEDRKAGTETDAA